MWSHLNVAYPFMIYRTQGQANFIGCRPKDRPPLGQRSVFADLRIQHAEPKRGQILGSIFPRRLWRLDLFHPHQSKYLFGLHAIHFALLYLALLLISVLVLRCITTLLNLGDNVLNANLDTRPGAETLLSTPTHCR